MQKTNQSNIRRENIESVFEAIAQKDGISRSEIAEKTGLSLMTVGKVADLLIMNGAARQQKPATGKSGRRAGFLTIANDMISMVCDISSDPMTATLVDLKMQCVGRTYHDYNYSRTPYDNLAEYFTLVSKLLLENLGGKKLIGTALIYS
jgi:predicted ArsR family transcriptional regulator